MDEQLYEIFMRGSETEERGIEAAGKFKARFFFQPIMFPLEKSKAIWDNCANVIASKIDDE